MDRNSKKFKALEAKWDAKLKASGFEDAENRQGFLKTWTCTIPDQYRSNAELTGAKEEYYRMAGQFYFDHKFGSARDKVAWWHHAQGVSIRDIVGILAKKGIKANKRQVHEALQALTKKMMKGSSDE